MSVDENQPLSLSDVSATMLVTLYARALETLTPNPILVDEKAVELRQALNPLLAQSEEKLYRDLATGNLPTMLVRTMALRARHFDQQVQDFLRRRPDGMIVNLGCGLDTRFYRLDDGRICLFDLDLPDVIALKRQLLTETNRYRFVASSVLDFDWMDAVQVEGKEARPALFLAEGLFMYLPPGEVRALVLALQDRFPGCELVGEVFNAKWLQGWRLRVVNRRLQGRLSLGEEAAFQFGLYDSNEMEGWSDGIQFLDDWSYFDEDESKLGQMRLLRHWDLFRKMQWTVHYRLNSSS